MRQTSFSQTYNRSHLTKAGLNHIQRFCIIKTINK